MYFVTVKTLLLHFQKRELEELQLQQRRQGCINEIIEEERLRLLKEHAAKLLGYLPKVSENFSVWSSWLVIMEKTTARL